MIAKLAASHPGRPIICISLFPHGSGDLRSPAKTAAHRQALKAICRDSGRDNIHFISGPDLLSVTGLSPDMLHPSDHGMIEIATKLTGRLDTILEKP